MFMKKYTLTRSVFIDAGTVLALTEAQARTRNASLDAVGDGVYKTTAITNFKAGEMIGLEVLPKSLESAVVVVAEKTARPAARVEKD